MNSNRPYLIRAIYEWIVDNQLTPYMVIDATYEGVQVPEEYVKDGKIVLNISPDACRGLHLENDRIIFTAKFSGLSMQVFVPPMGVIALYSKENGKGMSFSSATDYVPVAIYPTHKHHIESLENSKVNKPLARSTKTRLTLVKNSR